MSDLLFKIYFMGCNAKTKAVSALKKENGDTNIIAIVLLIVIVIALAVLFRKKIGDFVSSIWDKIFKNGDEDFPGNYNLGG